MVARAATAQPKGPSDVGTDDAARNSLAPATPHPSSVAGRALCRHSPGVGARCMNRARWDPCGGCPVTGISTAMRRFLRFDGELSVQRLAALAKKIGRAHV